MLRNETQRIEIELSIARYLTSSFHFARDATIKSCMRVCASKSQWRKLRKNAIAKTRTKRITESIHTASPRKKQRLEATDPFCSSQFAEYNEP